MKKATWNGKTIAESDACIEVENNYYFPQKDVNFDCLKPSEHTSICSWKGTAHYYHIVADDQINENAAWYYPDPKPDASQIKGYIAFWRGVKIS